MARAATLRREVLAGWVSRAPSVRSRAPQDGAGRRSAGRATRRHGRGRSRRPRTAPQTFALVGLPREKGVRRVARLAVLVGSPRGRYRVQGGRARAGGTHGAPRRDGATRSANGELG